jgi:hypothetical protein
VICPGQVLLKPRVKDGEIIFPTHRRDFPFSEVMAKFFLKLIRMTGLHSRSGHDVSEQRDP